jgi:hypothetical protein
MNRVILFLLLLVFSFQATPAFASETGFQFQMPGVRTPVGDDVNGFRIVFLYGTNRKVNGFDMGLMGFSEAATQSGFSWNFGVTRVDGPSSGAAFSFANIHTGSDSGLNASFVNIIKTIDNGLNLGFLNITESYSATDIGALSVSQKSRIQIGMVNVTERIDGVQIGLLNFAQNGFLPVFPFFNFPKAEH